MPFNPADLLLVILGFGMIVFVHELGHFLAARWAGIRVLAFALGFGPSIASYRPGLGWRRGSSEKEYLEANAGTSDTRRMVMSPTEYRLNILPLGGYVKMLGQDDLAPGATSAAPDSFQRCPPWKRLVVISAGVLMNLFTAAILFIIVMMIGREVDAPVLGAVEKGSPAAEARPLSPGVLPGLRPGDRVLSIDERVVRSFDDIVMATAMANKDQTSAVRVERGGRELLFESKLRVHEQTRLLSLGVAPARTNTLVELNNPVQRRRAIADFASVGLEGIEPGMTLVSVDGIDANGPQDIAEAARRSDGGPVTMIFRDQGGKNVRLTLTPAAQMEAAQITIGVGKQQRLVSVQHLAGLSGAVRVSDMPEKSEARRAGVLPGDVFARVGSVEYPSAAACINQIRAHAGKVVPLTVLREVGSERRLVVIDGARVSRDGTLGIHIGDSLLQECLIGSRENLRGSAPAIDIPPGSRIVRVGDKPVSDGASLRRELQRATDLAFNNSARADVTLWFVPPVDGVPGPAESALQRTLRLAPGDVKELAALGWELPIPADIFEIQKTTMRAGDPLSALKAGLAETKRVMTMTYLTFVRLVQGSIKVDQLKGPVGIAHLGTLVADRGIIWLLFFLALISVNLAVVNFLPLPIVDGGQFLFILYEWIRGRPVPVAVQNGVTLAGLVMIGAMFLLVTYNDVRNLLGI